MSGSGKSERAARLRAAARSVQFGRPVRPLPAGEGPILPQIVSGSGRSTRRAGTRSRLGTLGVVLLPLPTSAQEPRRAPAWRRHPRSRLWLAAVVVALAGAPVGPAHADPVPPRCVGLDPGPAYCVGIEAPGADAVTLLFLLGVSMFVIGHLCESWACPICRWPAVDGHDDDCPRGEL